MVTESNKSRTLLKVRDKKERGFIIILVAIALLVGLATPVILGQIEAGRERATKSEMKNIFQAIMGSKEKGDFGFLGDMGKLPETLTDLVVKPSEVLDFNNNHTNRVGMGWRGGHTFRALARRI